VLVGHFAAAILGRPALQTGLAIAGLPLAVLAVVYTAYLFAQARARDLWQNPLLPPHSLVQAVMAGSAALLPVAAWLEPAAVTALLRTLTGASILHLLLVLGEVTLGHPTAHAGLAVSEMVRGRYRKFFWLGLALSSAGALAPWIGVAAAPLALLGLLAHEHAYVQAGQSVPLA
jgi:Ni/Fe-hydrogenase subunit HybB-like protein